MKRLDPNGKLYLAGSKADGDGWDPEVQESFRKLMIAKSKKINNGSVPKQLTNVTAK